MILNDGDMEYLRSFLNARNLMRGNDGGITSRREMDAWEEIQERYLTHVCPECHQVFDMDAGWNGQDDEAHRESWHLLTDLGHVLIGCEGYWVINPELLGLERRGWQDWTELPEDVTGGDFQMLRNCRVHGVQTGLEGVLELPSGERVPTWICQQPGCNRVLEDQEEMRNEEERDEEEGD